MSIRHNILAAIAQDGATMDDICDRLGQPRKKLHDNVKSCVTDGLAIRGRDDITGLPFYTLTAAGRARLAEGPGIGGRKPSMTTQPEEVKITGSAALAASSEAPLRLSTKGCAVIEPPKQGDVPAEAGSDERMSFDQHFDGSDAHLLPRNAADCAAKLRQYNRWRRGEDDWSPDENGPNPKELGLLIDYAADALEPKVCCGEFETCREMCVVRADVYKSQRDELLDVFQLVIAEMEHRDRNDGNAPGHGHDIPGVWDSDNGALAGKPCAWCAVWKKAKELCAAIASVKGGAA